MGSKTDVNEFSVSIFFKVSKAAILAGETFRFWILDFGFWIFEFVLSKFFSDLNLRENESFIDVCAAPGSKTTFINSKRHTGNTKLFVAGDFYEHRIRSLRENCIRLDAQNIEFVRYDAEKSMPFADASFDVILLDAPCSGTGTIRHNPEIRYFLKPSDFIELSEKQLNILKNASKLLVKGGRLIYSTCSLEREENESVVENFLRGATNFRKVLPNVSERFLTAENFARTFPGRDSTDGFFIAVFEKV